MSGMDRKFWLVTIVLGMLLVSSVPSWGAGLPGATARQDTVGKTSISATPAASPAQTTEPRSLPAGVRTYYSQVLESAKNLANGAIGRGSVSGADIPYSQANVTIEAAASGFDGSSWTIFLGDGIAYPFSFRILPSQMTNNCTVTWVGTPPTSIFFPATPSTASVGTAAAYYFALYSAAHPGTYLVGLVVNGTGQLLYTAQVSSCSTYGYGTAVPSAIMDSPQVMNIFNSHGGTVFLTQHPQVEKVWLALPPNKTYATPPIWMTEYIATCGATIMAEMNAETGVVLYNTTSPCEYKVTFSESGLPPATLWSVTVGSSTFSSNTTSIAVLEKNGTYAYSIPVEPAYTASPSSGSLTVAGLPVNQTITFSPVPGEYQVTFVESGLPATTNWNIDLNGTFNSSSSNTLVFAEKNGTYFFVVGNIIPYAATPANGTLTVNGSSVTQTITFTRAPGWYSVTFTESGLPVNTFWGVTLNGTVNYTGTNSVGFLVRNGTVPFSADPPAGYLSSPSSGNLTVSGSSLSKSLVMTQAPGWYNVTFVESGLPVSTLWSVTLNGTPYFSIGTNLTSLQKNGTYNFVAGLVTGYAVVPANGSIIVQGSAVTQTLVYTAVVPGTFAITFTESGLPVGTRWSVSLNGTQQNSTAASILFYEKNGSFPYSIGSVTGYSAAPSSGTIVVAGKPIAKPITFTPGAAAYTVTFSESGLAPGTLWSVALSNTTKTSTTASLSFVLPNGVYLYLVGSEVGFTSAPSSGSVTVNGAPYNQTIVFTAIPAGSYPVTFFESGLAAGITWGATLNGATYNSSGTTVVFTEPNGTYHFTLRNVSGYTVLPASGSLSVSGQDASQLVTYTALPAGQYAVTFTESGLPSGTSWTVTLNGTAKPSTGTGLLFTEPNGSYPYTVRAVAGYQATPSSGTVNVTGSSTSRNIVFAKIGPKYSVTFSETGLKSGTNWSVTLGGTTHSSTTTTIVFAESNGTFAFTVGSVTGYSISPTTGSVSVSGAAASQAIAFSASSSGGGATTFLGLPSTEGYLLLLVVLVVIVAVVAGVAVMRSRRRKKGVPPSPPPAPGMSGNPPPPGQP